VPFRNGAETQSIARIKISCTAFNRAMTRTMDESITVMASSNHDSHHPEPERIGMDLEEPAPSLHLASQNDGVSPPEKSQGGAAFPTIAQPQQNGLKTGFDEENSEESEENDQNKNSDEDTSEDEIGEASFFFNRPITNSTDDSPIRSSSSHTQPPSSDHDTTSLPDPVIVRQHDYISRDIRDFLQNYPSRRPSRSTTNLDFYSNQIPFRPGGCTIDHFHTHLFGNHRTLELHHGYIQWLFPIREQGLNHYADPLQTHEAKIIRSDPQMQSRLVQSLKLMLDFYGMQVDETSSNPLLIVRHPDPLVCAEQYRNLCESWHNYLRITRIFKSLVELGQEDYVPSILLFILAEQSESGTLNRRQLRDSMDRFWVYCMREREAQRTVAEAIRWIRLEEGVVTMDGYRKMVDRRQSEGVWRFDPAGDGLKKRERRSRGFSGVFNGRLRNR